MSHFLTELSATEIDEFANLHRLDKPLVYQSDILGEIVTAPAGFITDKASIPRIPLVYDAEGGKCDKAAVIHDLLYSLGSAGLMQIDRETADRVLREAILASGYSRATAALFYAAVRAFGESHWNLPNVEQAPDVEEAMEGIAS
jgi:hypothetical protein